MATPQLSDLLTVPSQEEVLQQEVLPELQKRKVRISDWATGAVQRAFAYVVALMRVNVRLAIAVMVAAGFEDYVFGFSSVPANSDGSTIDVTGWAPIVAKQRYGVDQLGAVYTKRTITLTNTSATPYGPLQPGAALMLQFPSGNRYLLDQVVTIPALGSVQATFRAENAGASYNSDPSGAAIVLVTANYPGVTATNPSTTFSTVSQAGSGLGGLDLTGSPVGTHSVVVRIDTSGTAAGLTVGWSTNVDNAGWVTQSGASATNLGGFGINVGLLDNGGSPAFIKGAFYYFSTPGSDVTQTGADAETPQSLGTRCRALWPSLAFAKAGDGSWIPTSPTIAAYQALALSANSQVRIALAATDGTVNNKVNLIIAGQGGVPLSGGVVANVQSFFNSYTMLTDAPLVATTTGRAITLAGLTVTCPSALRTSVQTAMTLRLQNYLGSVDTAAPLGINGLVDYDYIIGLVRMTPGVARVSGTLTINAVAANYQMPGTPNAFESATWSQSAATAFTFVTT